MASPIQDVLDKYPATMPIEEAPPVDDLLEKYQAQGNTLGSEDVAPPVHDLLDKYPAMDGQDGSRPVEDLLSKYPAQKKTAMSPALLPPQGVKDSKRIQAEAPRQEGAIAAAGRSAATGLLPAIGALKAGVVAGGAVTAATAPVLGPFAPLAGVAGGLIAAIGAGMGVRKLQDLGLEKIVGPERFQQMQAQEAANRETHPYATFAGEVAPSFIAMGGSLRNVRNAWTFGKTLLANKASAKAILATEMGQRQLANLVNVASGTGTEAGQEIYRQIQEGDFRPVRLTLAMMVGAYQNEPTRFGRALGFTSTAVPDSPADSIRRSLGRKGLPPSPKAAVPEDATRPIAEDVGVPPPREPIITTTPVAEDVGVPLVKATIEKTLLQELVDAGVPPAVAREQARTDYVAPAKEAIKDMPYQERRLLLTVEKTKRGQMEQIKKLRTIIEKLDDDIDNMDMDSPRAQTLGDRQARLQEKLSFLEKQELAEQLKTREVPAPAEVREPTGAEAEEIKGAFRQVGPSTESEAMATGRPVAEGEAKPPELMTPEEQRIAAGTKVVGDTAKERPIVEPVVPQTRLNDWLDNFDAKTKARFENVLRSDRRINGKPDTQAEYVERSVAEGARVVTRKNGRRSLEHTDGRFMYESDLSKAALDYAEHLSATSPPPTAKPAAKAPPSDVPTFLRTAKRDIGQSISMPEGATFLRVTDTNGRTSTLGGADFKGANPLEGVDIAKVEAGIRTKEGFKPVEGDVQVMTPERQLALLESKKGGLKGYALKKVQEKIDRLKEEIRQPKDVTLEVNLAPVRDAIATSEGAPQAKRVAESLRKMDEDVKNHFRFSWSRMRDKLASAFRDVPRPVLRRLEGTAYKQALSDALDQVRGAGPKADLAIQEANGRIENILGRDISPTDLDDRIFATRLIEATELQAKRGVEHKNPYGLTVEEAREFLAQQDAVLVPEGVARMNQATDEYWKVMLDSLDRLHTEGLISDAAYESLKANHRFYSPMDFIQHMDPDGEALSPRTGKSISVPDSGIEKLKGGSELALISNHRYLLGQVAARTEARIAKNSANTRLAALATDANNPLGVKAGNVNGNVPTGYDPIHYMAGGKKQQILVPSDLAKYWATTDPTISKKVVEVMGWLSGAQPVRALATGYNPEFAWRNTFMDSAYTWFRTEEYSSFLPVAMGQRAYDLLKVAGDAWRQGDRTKQFIRNSGSMEFLSNQGGLLRQPWQHETRLRSSLEKAERFFSKLNQWSELMGRLATQERHITNESQKLGRAPTDVEMAQIQSRAALAARNVIDFNKGGWLVKAVDRMGIPYLNAAFRAVDGLFESAAKSPALFSFKLGQLAVMSSGLAYWAWKTSPKTMESIPDREREGYWIVPLGDLAAKDAQGKPKYLYLRFRKDQAGRAIAATAETFTEKMMGRKVNGNRIAMGLSDLSPVDIPQMMFPIVSAMNSYAMNKNQWTREDIWKGAKVEPHAEYYSHTPSSLVSAAEGLSKIGIEVSPERLKQSSARVFPYNAWTSMMGGAVDALVGKDEKVRQTLAQRILESPGVRAILGSTREFDLRDSDVSAARRLKVPLTNPDGSQRASASIRNEIDDATVMTNTKRQVLNNHLDRIIQLIRTKEMTRQDASQWIMSVEDIKERGRLIQRLNEKLKPVIVRKPPPMP